MIACLPSSATQHVQKCVYNKKKFPRSPLREPPPPTPPLQCIPSERFCFIQLYLSRTRHRVTTTTTKTTVVCTEVRPQRELPSRSGSLTATLTARSSCGYSWLAGRNFSITVAALVLVRPPGERPTHGHPRSPRLLEVRAHPELYVRAVRMVLLDWRDRW